MARPTDASQPRLASGCRLGASDNDAVVLFPEGVIQVQGPGRHILEHCDGKRSLGEIVEALEALYSGAAAGQVREDVAAFLEELQQQRIVDY